ncbi:hypothetical protein GQX74_009001 [Glossina fuscipes]|nr:hypothetical protein GQX74_009001 [Glossina fuscipes]
MVKIFDDNIVKCLLANRLKQIEQKKFADMKTPFSLLGSRLPNLKCGETYVIFLKREQRRELARQIHMLSRECNMEEFNQFPANLISDENDMQQIQNSSTTNSDCSLKDFIHISNNSHLQIADPLKKVERSLNMLGPLADESFCIYMDRLFYLLSLLFTALMGIKPDEKRKRDDKNIQPMTCYRRSHSIVTLPTLPIPTHMLTPLNLAFMANVSICVRKICRNNCYQKDNETTSNL